MAAVSARTRCAESSAGRWADRFEDSSSSAASAPAGSVVWGVAMLDAGQRVTGMIGPFASATAAEDHARAHCRGPWTVAPMLCLPLPDGTQVR